MFFTVFLRWQSWRRQWGTTPPPSNTTARTPTAKREQTNKQTNKQTTNQTNKHKHTHTHTQTNTKDRGAMPLDCLFVCLCVCVFVFVCLCLFVYVFVCLFVCVCSFVCSFCLPVNVQGCGVVCSFCLCGGEITAAAVAIDPPRAVITEGAAAPGSATPCRSADARLHGCRSADVDARRSAHS